MDGQGTDYCLLNGEHFGLDQMHKNKYESLKFYYFFKDLVLDYYSYRNF